MQFHIAFSVFFVFAGNDAALDRQISEIEGSAAPAVQSSEEACVSHPVADGFRKQSLGMDTEGNGARKSLGACHDITVMAVNGVAVGAGLGVCDALPFSEADRCPFACKSVGCSDRRHQGLTVGLIIGSCQLFRKFLSNLYILPVPRHRSAAKNACQLGIQVGIQTFQFLFCVVRTSFLTFSIFFRLIRTVRYLIPIGQFRILLQRRNAFNDRAGSQARYMFIPLVHEIDPMLPDEEPCGRICSLRRFCDLPYPQKSGLRMKGIPRHDRKKPFPFRACVKDTDPAQAGHSAADKSRADAAFEQRRCLEKSRSSPPRLIARI